MLRKKKADTGPGSFYQDDFGGFNPRFGGVTIRIASQGAYDEFVSFLTSDTLPGDKEEPFGPILMRSVMEHELRHYHDFLLGSYNGMLFRSRLQAVMNGIKALRAVKELPGDVFPLPLSKRMTLTAHERDAWLEEWAAFSIDGKNPVVIPVPMVSKEELLRPRDSGFHAIDDDPAAVFSLAAEHAARGYAKIHEAAEGTHGSNTGSARLECSVARHSSRARRATGARLCAILPDLRNFASRPPLAVIARRIVTVAGGRSGARG